MGKLPLEISVFWIISPTECVNLFELLGASCPLWVAKIGKLLVRHPFCADKYAKSTLFVLLKRIETMCIDNSQGQLY